ncbi:MAG: lysophospholipid acyltransferase family protein [Elusimicrobia bacterium]|nr:lysophospholipid acyltransferase family protein [Elusimicrobiota bacterium]
MKPRFLLEYAGVRLLDFVLSRLSWEACQALGAFIGRTAAAFGRGRWAMTVANVAAAFPELSRAEHEAIALQAWENAGRIAAEFCRTRHLSKDELLTRVSFEHLDLVDRTVAEGKGVLYNIGHLGNWETGGIAFTAKGYQLGVVGRVMRNPLLDRWMTGTRSRFGEQVFAHRNPFFQVVRWLKAGKGTAILIDHNLYQGGVFVPFFGRPAATSTLSGLLAVKLGCPVLSTRVRREGSGLVVSFHGPLRADPGAEPEAEARRLTVEMTRQIEGFIRERPGEWLWGHNRWKRTHEAAQEASPPAA